MEPENLVLQPRDVQFDWSTLPMNWVPDEPVTTHVMNVLHLLLPEASGGSCGRRRPPRSRPVDELLARLVLGESRLRPEDPAEHVAPSAA